MGADRKRKEARKRKFGTLTSSDEIEREPAQSEPSHTNNEKQDTGTKQDWQPTDHTSNAEDDLELTVPTAIAKANEQSEAVENLKEKKSQRFIVFIGNLPFTATEESIARHFAKIQPRSIRHGTDRETGKPNGFAFLEFEAYDRMKTCLSLYHHSTFDDGNSPARDLNVELTVGGGGAKSNRQAKLKMKNVKLAEERQRRAIEAEKQAKIEGSAANVKSAKKVPKRPSIAKETKTSQQISELVEVHGDIHPSRRNRLDLR